VQLSARPQNSIFPCSVLVLTLLTLAILIVCLPQRIESQAKSPKHLLIYTIDVEGGQSTLIVSPSGGSLLVDTGWADHEGRDVGRIQTAMKDAGITRIDHVFITHYHTDHVGAVPDLVQHVSVGEFDDHGPNREDSDVTRRDYAAYVKAIEGKPRRSIDPRDTIPISDLKVVVLTENGEHVDEVPGVEPTPNPYCATERKWPDDPSENARSAGILVTFGKFRFLDLGDLTGHSAD
jgi:competence protein ComEC